MSKLKNQNKVGQVRGLLDIVNKKHRRSADENKEKLTIENHSEIVKSTSSIIPSVKKKKRALLEDSITPVFREQSPALSPPRKYIKPNLSYEELHKNLSSKPSEEEVSIKNVSEASSNEEVKIISPPNKLTQHILENTDSSHPSIRTAIQSFAKKFLTSISPLSTPKNKAGKNKQTWPKQKQDHSTLRRQNSTTKQNRYHP